MNPRSRRENIFIEKLPGQTILYDKVSHQAHCLNATAAKVWECADGTRTIEDLARILEEALGISKDNQVVLLSLEQLEQSGLMEPSGETVGRSNLRSRRDMARELAVAGLSASLFPLVASVLAPTPAMAASASGPPSTISSYGQEFGTVAGDLKKHASEFENSPVAQADFQQGVNAGNQGIVATLQGNNTLAQNDFQAATSDFDGVLKALGLGPL